MNNIRCICLIGILCWGAPLVAEETSPQFKRFDSNQDGQLTKDELDRPIFGQIDTDGDGIITAKEDQAFSQLRRRGQANRVETGPMPSEKVKAELDIPYADTDNPRQRLDLYLPKTLANDKPLPVVVFIHGGGWQNGDKRGGYRHLGQLVESGEYAAVSIGYRLTDEAQWPAQIHDCKAAIRWIKANAKKHHLDPDRIGATGTSAGGHLVAMLGTSGDVAVLEGELGSYREVNGSVACVVDQFGPTDFLAMGGRHDNPQSPEAKLIGGAVQEHQDEAKNASPITYVSQNDPPFMFLHGTEDAAVPYSQSELLAAALKKVGCEPLLIPVVGAGHGNFGTPEAPERMKQFFDKHLRGKEVTISTEPIQRASKR